MWNFLIDRLIGSLRGYPLQGKGFVFDRFVSRHGFRDASVFGYRVSLDLSDLIQRGVYLGCFERLESLWVRRILKPGMTFVDAGANVGYFSFLAASRVGDQGKVIAFEPNPRLNQRLAEWIRDNRIQQLSLFHEGLSDYDGQIVLHLPPNHIHNENATMIPWDDLQDWQKVDVPVVRLDRKLQALGITQVDLLKLDVEGHEPRILAGLGNLLAQGIVRNILCEFNEPALQKTGWSSASLRDFLLEKGFLDVTPRPWNDDDWLQNRIFQFKGLSS
ncbi:MAG: hypothetical protein RJA81_377 [Planctomycetota bacterium]